VRAQPNYEKPKQTIYSIESNQLKSQVKMFAEESINRIAGNEQEEFEFYMLWDWPQHIETALRRMLWIAFVEMAEDINSRQPHTCFLRRMIAACPDSPAEALEFLSNFTDPSVLVRVAENPKTAASTLQKLAAHPKLDVRLAVVDNSNTPLPILMEMAIQEGADVRFRLAENPALPAKLLQQLAEDSNAYVSTRAMRTLARRNSTGAAVQALPPRRKPEQERKAM
jgi:hypothetical protein